MSQTVLDVVSTSSTKIQHVVSPLGIQAWLVESSIVPLIALNFTFEGGAAQDEPHLSGTAQLMAQLLDEGAGAYTSDAFQERLAAHAIELGFGVTQDGFSGSLKTLVKHADEAFELLRLAIFEPRFDTDAIERTRAQTLAGLRYHAKDPNHLSSKGFFAHAFPKHPYGLGSSGSVETVPFISRDDLVNMHQMLTNRRQLKVVAVGAISASQLAQRLDDMFGGLGSESELRAIPKLDVQGLGMRHVIDLDVPQSVIRFGTHGLSRHDPDYIPAYVLNHILGGGAFTSRLFQEVREKRGLAYSVGTSLTPYRGSAVLTGYTATKNERVEECLSVIREEMLKLRDEGPSDDELKKAKSYLVGSYPLNFDTSTKIAGQLAQIFFDNMGIDYTDRRNSLINAVTQEDIYRAAQRVIGNGDVLTVIAGRPVLN